uniref:Amino acid transporter transmembrane domain-containing protein n=1 Tax=Cucumis melo TaxID=3656 RepID=A0A9I9D341_CUCME
MKSSVSEQSFLYESEDEEEDQENVVVNKDEEDGNDSDSSDDSTRNQRRSKPDSYTTTWPQSYRQSMDMLGSVPSPNIGILGTSSLTRWGSSFLSSSLTRRHTPDTLTSTSKPLLATVTDENKDEQQPLPPLSQRLSSHSLILPLTSRRPSGIKKDDKPSKVPHEFPTARRSSFSQAMLNGGNVLCGVGILTTPYAAKEGGWLGLSILLIFAVASCIEYIILESDNLSSLFPNAHLNVGGYELNAHLLFALMTTIAVLPTVYLRDLSVLSYISAGGVIASILVVLCLFWIGLVDGVGFQGKETTTLLNPGTLPIAIGLYGYCYSGHAVFPNIYSSMSKPSQYPSVLLTCFVVCTLMYAGVAFVGYSMFGESTMSQFTLNLPTNLVASKIAVWTTVVNPFTKYALTLTPIALSLEELIPSNHPQFLMLSILIRTALVVSTLLVGLGIPFFGLILSLVGSLLTMFISLILPCACFLSILKGKVTRLQGIVCVIIMVIGLIAAAFGTYSSVLKIVQNLST